METECSTRINGSLQRREILRIAADHPKDPDVMEDQIKQVEAEINPIVDESQAGLAFGFISRNLLPHGCHSHCRKTENFSNF